MMNLIKELVNISETIKTVHPSKKFHLDSSKSLMDNIDKFLERGVKSGKQYIFGIEVDVDDADDEVLELKIIDRSGQLGSNIIKDNFKSAGFVVKVIGREISIEMPAATNESFQIDSKLQSLLQSLLEADQNNNNEFKDGFFALGYWINPHRPQKEYFWSGPFIERKDAVAFNKMKQQRGQPKQFIDWGKGSGTVIVGLDKFLLAAKKVGLNPNVSNLEWK